MVWFSNFHRKISYTSKFDVDTSTPSCEDWKESEKPHPKMAPKYRRGFASRPEL